MPPPPSGLLAGSTRPDAVPRRRAAARPVLADAAAAIERVVGGARLGLAAGSNEPGGSRTSHAFRAEQVVWGSLGGGRLVLAALLWVARAGRSRLGGAARRWRAAVGGVAGPDQLPHPAGQRREERMLAEFPTIAELLALAVAAGEGAVGALERVCRLSSGELTRELRRCLADARAGARCRRAGAAGRPDRAAQPDPLRRRRRGRRRARHSAGRGAAGPGRDVREVSRRALMEAGGRKEIAMMVPVVFLVLPVTVLFAVFPGIAYLSFTI